MQSLAQFQSIWPHSAVLIKCFLTPSGLLLPGREPKPPAPPRFLVGKRRRQDKSPSDDLLRHFPSLPLAPRCAVGRSPALPGEAAGAHVTSRTTTPLRPPPCTAASRVQSVPGLAPSPAPPV